MYLLPQIAHELVNRKNVGRDRFNQKNHEDTQEVEEAKKVF